MAVRTGSPPQICRGSVTGSRELLSFLPVIILADAILPVYSLCPAKLACKL